MSKKDKDDSKKKVCICKKCSGVDVDEIKKLVGKKSLNVECIEECHKHKGKSFGIINGELVICDTKQEFLDKVKEII